jgi:hypothetical protein
VRITRDKLNKIAHTVADALAEIDEVEFLEDRNTVRQKARDAMEKVPENRLAAKNHPRRQPGVGHPLSEVLQRRSEEARPLTSG